jgi:hypothetical protein
MLLLLLSLSAGLQGKNDGSATLSFMLQETPLYLEISGYLSLYMKTVGLW